MNRLSALVPWFAALLLAGGALAPGGVQAQAGPVSLDASITSRVVTVIDRDPLLKAMQIKVQTQGGIVSLTGFVRSMDDIAKAGKLARAVSGVSAVRNGLRVENRPSQA